MFGFSFNVWFWGIMFPLTFFFPFTSILLRGTKHISISFFFFFFSEEIHLHGCHLCSFSRLFSITATVNYQVPDLCLQFWQLVLWSLEDDFCLWCFSFQWSHFSLPSPILCTHYFIKRQELYWNLVLTSACHPVMEKAWVECGYIYSSLCFFFFKRIYKIPGSCSYSSVGHSFIRRK